MKKKLLAIVTILLSHHIFALSIRDVTISGSSQNSVNVSLTTEAVELYYFHSWNYSVAENAIIVDAFFVSGFGSTIAYLNNNFEIPLNAAEPAHYRLLVRVYYLDLSEVAQAALFQDEFKLEFKTPFYGTLTPYGIENLSSDLTVSPNPTSGMLYTSEDFSSIFVFDKMGREMIPVRFFYKVVDLSDLENGTYYIAIISQERVVRKRVLLQK